MRTLAALLAIVILGFAQLAHAQRGCIADPYGSIVCGPAGSRCLRDIHGEVRCSPPDGGIVLDRYKTPVCGPGRCIVGRYGDAYCSSVPQGSAALNARGEPVCTEGCVRATAEACVVPSR